MTYLIVKHFFLDFTIMQPPYMWMNKGNIKHPGGYLHAGLHVLFSTIVIHSWPILLFEFISHYAMDWTKVNINKRMGWGPTTHSQWFVLLGVDQLVHYITYIIMIALYVN